MPDESNPPPAPSRGQLNPFEEIELTELKARMAFMDEQDTMFDAGTHPTPVQASEEGVTDGRPGFHAPNSSRMPDLMADTPPVERELGATDVDVASEGLPELETTAPDL